MKKYGLFFITMLFFAFASKGFGQINYSKDLFVQKYRSFGRYLVLTMDDGSMWELFCFNPRSRTLCEWWDGKELKVDNQYLWNKDSWMLEDRVTIGDNTLFHELEDVLKNSDEERYRSYRCIIANINTQKVAFARPIDKDMLIDLLLEYAKEEYNSGYSNGNSSGFWDGNFVGYSTGYNAGYQNGQQSH